MTIEKQRLNYIDWAKAISICLVVTGHFLPYGCWPKALMYSFHVPIFAVIGGILCKPPETFKDYWNRIPKLILRLLVPYTIWFTIFAIPHLFPEAYIPSIVKKHYEISDLWKLFLFWENDTIWNLATWFLPAYFIISLLYPLYLKITEGRWIPSGIFALVFFGVAGYLYDHGISIDFFGVENIMGVLNIIVLFGFFALGYAIKGVVHFITTQKDNPRKNPLLYMAICIFILTACFAVSALAVDNPKNPAGYYPLSLYDGKYDNMERYLLVGVILSVSLITACGLLPESKTVQLLSRNSFFIMLTHYAFFLDKTFQALPREDWKTDLSFSIRDSVFIIVVYIIVLHLINRTLIKYPKLRKITNLFGIQ